eukprot:9504008-Pyramimonas_sp.AAC.2
MLALGAGTHSEAGEGVRAGGMRARAAWHAPRARRPDPSKHPRCALEGGGIVAARAQRVRAPVLPSEGEQHLPHQATH